MHPRSWFISSPFSFYIVTRSVSVLTFSFFSLSLISHFFLFLFVPVVFRLAVAIESERENSSALRVRIIPIAPLAANFHPLIAVALSAQSHEFPCPAHSLVRALSRFSLVSSVSQRPIWISRHGAPFRHGRQIKGKTTHKHTYKYNYRDNQKSIK